jgi:CRISPR-associated endonuclease/helicase Cas3
LAFAAEAHDLGKDRAVWQRSIRNDKYPKRVLAKSGQRRPPRDLSSYRHEFGSVLDVLSLADTGGPLAEKWVRLSELEQDLALHFIASHHGRARPHFPPDEAFDPERSSSQAAEAAREVPLRFARLQRKYGRWGLAYLESILRAADAAASANPSDTLTGSNASPVKVGAAEGSR